jgi:hypothetical protein
MARQWPPGGAVRGPSWPDSVLAWGSSLGVFNASSSIGGVLRGYQLAPGDGLARTSRKCKAPSLFGRRGRTRNYSYEPNERLFAAEPDVGRHI